jgi:phytoene dehydrogenase-like protein
MSATRDAIIIGGGHNGLITAFYLAKAGLKPLVLERRPAVGGAAISDEFHPGFRCPTLAHACGPVLPEIAQDMELGRHGLEMIKPAVRVFAPLPDRRYLLLYDDPARSAQQIAKFSAKDAERYPELASVLARVAAVMRQVATRTPPSTEAPRAGELLELLKTGRAFRSLGKKDMFRLLRWTPMPVADLVAEWSESQVLRAVLAARGIFGTFLGPWSAGSGAVLLMRSAADPYPVAGAAFPRGGMGSLTQAMARAAIAAGAEVRTDVEVAEVSIRDSSASGVVLATGEAITARIVVSNADPRRTFLHLVGPAHLSPDFLNRIQNYRCLGTVAKVNLALAGLPTFRAVAADPDAGPAGDAALKGGATSALVGRIHIGPEVDYLERAFDAAKYGDFSRQPVLDAMIPSVADPSLAPEGQHVMSICVQFAPYRLRNSDWSGQRDALGDVVVEKLSEYASDLPDLILHRQVITPQDLEDTYSLTGGHIFHGELALDQLFTMRPLLGWAQYRTPLRGLYLCGNGTHPGTGLTGASGRNAAREIVKDWKGGRIKESGVRSQESEWPSNRR